MTVIRVRAKNFRAKNFQKMHCYAIAAALLLPNSAADTVTIISHNGAEEVAAPYSYDGGDKKSFLQTKIADHQSVTLVLADIHGDVDNMVSALNLGCSKARQLLNEISEGEGEDLISLDLYHKDSELPEVPHPVSTDKKVDGAESILLSLDVLYNGERFILQNVRSSDTIASLKIKIQDERGMPPEQQRLTLGFTVQLEDEKTLADYKIGSEAGNIVNLVVYGRLYPRMTVTVKDGSAFRRILLRLEGGVNEDTPIKVVKEKISERYREVNNKELIQKGKEYMQLTDMTKKTILENDMTLKDEMKISADGREQECTLVVTRMPNFKQVQYPQRTRVVFLGDYEHRGPYTKRVYENLFRIKDAFGDDRTTFLIGNHDLMALGLSWRYVHRPRQFFGSGSPDREDLPIESEGQKEARKEYFTYHENAHSMNAAKFLVDHATAIERIDTAVGKTLFVHAGIPVSRALMWRDEWRNEKTENKTKGEDFFKYMKERLDKDVRVRLRDYLLKNSENTKPALGGGDRAATGDARRSFS